MTEPFKDKAEELKKVLEGKKPEAEEKAPDYYDKYLRAVAELDNFKKRVAKEQAEHFRYANETLMRELLKVLDDFEQIMNHLPKEESPSTKGLIHGIQLVHRDFWKILHKLGLKEIDTQHKKFDPHLHEAVAAVESESEPEGTIVQLHRKGYQFHDRLLRPAAVSVAKRKESSEKK